jgi:hypothetical protein
MPRQIPMAGPLQVSNSAEILQPPVLRDPSSTKVNLVTSMRTLLRGEILMQICILHLIASTSHADDQQTTPRSSTPGIKFAGTRALPGQRLTHPWSFLESSQRPPYDYGCD